MSRFVLALISSHQYSRSSILTIPQIGQQFHTPALDDRAALEILELPQPPNAERFAALLPGFLGEAFALDVVPVEHQQGAGFTLGIIPFALGNENAIRLERGFGLDGVHRLFLSIDQNRLDGMEGVGNQEITFRNWNSNSSIADSTVCFSKKK